MTIDEAIKHCEEVAEENEKNAKSINNIYKKSCLECASEHRQLAAWLRELEESRKIIDIMSQFLVDSDLDICCDELMDDETERSICEETCHNLTKECQIRRAKMKAREVNADET